MADKPMSKPVFDGADKLGLKREPKMQQPPAPPPPKPEKK